MGGAGDQTRAPHLLITGIYGLRDIVLSLPRLTALRTSNPDAKITMAAPALARDLLLRLRVVNDVWLLDERSVFSVVLRGWFKRLTGVFDRVVNGAALADSTAVAWAKLARDVSFVAPPVPYVLFALPDHLPVLRAAAFLRKLEMLGYHAALLGLRDTPELDRLHKAAPAARNLAGRVDLSDVPALAAGAVAVVGGRDAMTTLAALWGARTVIVTQGADDALDQLPVDNTVWLQSDDLSYLAVGDIIKAVLP